jgi:hypothetical protein
MFAQYARGTDVTDWLIPALSSPVLLGLGVAVQRWMSHRAQSKRDAVSDYQALVDVERKGRHDCEERLDKVENRLDDCERKHGEAEQRNSRLESDFNNLREEVLRRYVDSDRPKETR